VAARDLRSLPKAELHLHLHGAMRRSTLVELSTAAGLTAPDPRAFADFTGFQPIYRAAHASPELITSATQRLDEWLADPTTSPPANG
jgi:adenosine deaminase